MPFIAIAAFIALALGGGVTVAADHAHQGDMLYGYKTQVNDHAREVYHSLKTSLHIEAEAEDDQDISGDTHLSSGENVGDTDDGAAGGASGEVQGALRVRSDASDEVKFNDDMIEGNGSVHVNVY